MTWKWLAAVCVFGLLGLLSMSAGHRKAAPGAGLDAAILVGAGDIADCKDLSGAEATARLLEQIQGTVMAVGDLAYPDGSRENFKCYERTWGRVKARTRPAAGNHEFHATGLRRTSSISGLRLATRSMGTTVMSWGPGMLWCLTVNAGMWEVA